ncbi:hypothetical protein SAMN05444166_0213 [Singulisphaera sp. GP187]|uniref:GAP1-N1 domain-containing protein n=1 Tax=Singulisphaera sp. GP187 TaxID=1882752 RepID=UPI00092BBC7C|nr:hypothetical protein [Singulisphaera sp. GP187]SIN69872.1 hypothetical protein SAMN05444166_0213 [Singulisphaera sp. GP187]
MSTVLVHQLLHGYRKGHQLLAGSVRLSSDAEDLAARISDLSGALPPGTPLSPYLTAYPVAGSDYYAIARTHLDEEAPRSGCVLTHTLLVPKEGWKRFRNLRALGAYLLPSPTSRDKSRFNSPLEIDLNEFEGIGPQLALEVSGGTEFVAKYFGEGNRPVAWFDCEAPEETLWAVLSSLWPSLRQRFSACTFCLQPRSTADGPFDLMFAPGSSYPRYHGVAREGIIRHFQPATSQGTSSHEPWIEELSASIFGGEDPSLARELGVFGPQLGGDPTLIRTLFLLRELRSRLSMSLTAGVGLMDLLETVAPGPGDAIGYKEEILGEALVALEAAQGQDALRSLFLIGERLSHPAYGLAAHHAAPRLALAVAAGIPGHVQEAVSVPCRSLASPRGMTRPPYVDGLLRGLERVAEKAPSSLLALREHPDTAGMVVCLSPIVARGYLMGAKRSGPEALQPLVRWVAEASAWEVREQLREHLLPEIERDEQASLAEELLRDLPHGRAYWAMDVLYQSTRGFRAKMVREVACEVLAARHRDEVREWGRRSTDWSDGSAEVVGATFESSALGLRECVSYSPSDDVRRSEVLAAFLERSVARRFPTWLREYARQSGEFLLPLLAAGSRIPPRVERCITRMLDEGFELPVARTPELLPALDGLSLFNFFPQLADQALQSALKDFVGGNIDLRSCDAWITTTWGSEWLDRIPAGELSRLLRPDARELPSRERAWSWVAQAPSVLYGREPSVLPGLIEGILPGPFDEISDAICIAWIAVLRRSKHEASPSTHLQLCFDAIGFSFGHLRRPLGAVVAEAFPTVYEVISTSSGQEPSGIFRFFHWDRAKELRKALVAAFLDSGWRPGDLAIAAGGEQLLRKVFKRVRKRWKGDLYIEAMLEDLASRDEPRAIESREVLQRLYSDPDFYEPWD